MQYFINYFSNPENVMAFLSHGSTVLISALLAFYLSFKLYMRQKRLENLNYLRYSIASLTYLVNNLYNFKRDIVKERYEEATQIDKKMNNHDSSKTETLELRIEHMSLFIHNNFYPWPLAQEQLQFLAARDPNLILILGTASLSVATLNSVIKEVNNNITENKDASSLFYLISNTKLLKEQLDSTLYLVDKCIDLLIEYGQKEFRNKAKISSTFIRCSEDQKLKPPAIETWEKMDWLPAKQSLCKRIYHRFRSK